MVMQTIKKMNYRDNTKLLTLVLDNTQSEIAITKLQMITNTNHSRLKLLLTKLISSDLVVSFDNKHVITKKGRIMLESWKKSNYLAESFGLEI